jgi:hypothetical protein
MKIFFSNNKEKNSVPEVRYTLQASGILIKDWRNVKPLQSNNNNKTNKE